MTRAVASGAWRRAAISMVEAGTGTGKSLAYLIPAALCRRWRAAERVVVSTNTINLQEQLVAQGRPGAAGVAERDAGGRRRRRTR